MNLYKECNLLRFMPLQLKQVKDGEAIYTNCKQLMNGEDDDEDGSRRSHVVLDFYTKSMRLILEQSAPPELFFCRGSTWTHTGN